MGNNKLVAVYFLILIGSLGLLRMMLGYTDLSFIKAVLILGGTTLLIIAIHKEKSTPKYLQGF